MSLPDRMKEQRKRMHLTQPELAKALGMSVDSIKKMETGKMNPSVETLVKMGELFDCTTDYLLGKTDSIRAVAIETWDDFHDYMLFSARLLRTFDPSLADILIRSLSNYPSGNERIPPEKEEQIKEVLSSTLEKFNKPKPEPKNYKGHL